MTQARSHRAEPRISAQVEVRLETAGKSLRFQTHNIGAGGVFVRAQTPPPLRQINRVQLTLEDGESLNMLGMVAHRIDREEADKRGLEPGFGLRLFPRGKATLDAWRGFVDRKALDAEPQASADPAPQIGPLRIVLNSPESVEKFINEDLPSAEIHYRTDSPRPEGADLDVEIVDARTGATLPLHASVAGHTEHGMRLEFQPLDDEAHRAFRAFVAAALEG